MKRLKALINAPAAPRIAHSAEEEDERRKLLQQQKVALVHGAA